MWRCFVRDQARVPSVAGAGSSLFRKTEQFLWAMALAESTTSPQRSLFSDTKTHPTIATSAGAAKYMVIMCRGTLPALCRCQTGLRRLSRPVRDP